jgi:hypothetical protein
MLPGVTLGLVLTVQHMCNRISGAHVEPVGERVKIGVEKVAVKPSS